MMKAASKKILKRIIIILAALYLILCTLLYLLQERLIFPLAYKNTEDTAASLPYSNVINPLTITARDGCELRGYYIRPENQTNNNFMFYFGANAEDISLLSAKMTQFSDYNIVMLHYRGYGNSDGKPSDQKLYEDAQDIYDYMINSDALCYDKIIITGRSIGSSVAAYLSSTRENTAAILITPFDTLSHVVSQKCPILPVGLLLKSKFDTTKYAPNIKSHVYIITGENDWIVPTKLTNKLMTYFTCPVTYQEISGVGHNTIDDVDEYWEIINRILSEQNRKSRIPDE